MSNEIVVFYYFQGELGESIETPNAFIIPSMNPSLLTFKKFQELFLSLNHINQNKIKNLHYRFKIEEKTCGYMWMDINNNNDIIQINNNIIHVKILCLDSSSINKRDNKNSKLKWKKNLNNGVENSKLTHSTSNNPMQDNNDMNENRNRNKDTNNKPNSNTINSNNNNSSENIFEFADFNGSTSSNNEIKSESTNNININNNSFNQQIVQEGIIETNVEVGIAAPKISREELVKKREQAVDENVRKALEEKKEVSIYILNI
jgi:hypothetical protein